MTDIFTSLGQKKLVGGIITEKYGKPIDTDTIVVGWGGPSTPPARGSGQAPTFDNQGESLAQRIVTLLVDDTSPALSGRYLWGWVDDVPEIEPVRLAGPYTTA